MRSSTLLTSALAAGALALPQGQLEKRQQLTVFNTVTVTTTVFVNPYATPAWAGPPRVSNPPRPTNIPPPPVVNIPSPDAFRTSSRPALPTPRPSSTSRPGVTSSSTRLPSSSVPTRVSTPPANTGGALPTGAVPPSSSLRSSSSAVVGVPISNTAVPSSVVPPTPSGAPLDPGHTPGAGQASLSVASGDAYINAILFHHNAARANHGAAPLVWNDTVAATARITAETCRFEHYIPPNVRQGQNLFTISGNYFNVTAGITESWYKDEFPPMLPYFGQASIPNTVFSQVGHLTQVLWKGTTSVGCYSLDCSGRMVVGTNTNSPLNKYTVCNYYPAGNVATQYAINVGTPISTTNLGSWIN